LGVVLLIPIGAPLKHRADASGAGSATAVPSPIFFPAAPPVFLEHTTIFFGAPYQLFFRSKPI
tara:strand:- start:411 stop:599 length:189 start_codon:yes stop_codon:yes gene_type:complete